MINNKDFINQACADLKGVSTRPFIESQWILSSILKTDVSDIYKRAMTKDETEIFFEKINQRKKGWPLAYILKEAYFFNFSFYIDHGVFIPRPESEIIIQEALKLDIPYIRGIDFGSGSGVLPITLLNKKPHGKFLALEISSPSLKCLKINRDRFHLKDRLYILNQSVSSVKYQDVVSFLKDKPNLILANPPYVKSEDKNLHSEVRNFEPPLSLFSPEEGLFCIYSWFHKAMDILEDEGVYIFEFGYDQGDQVVQFLNKNSSKYKIIKDDQGFKRVAVCWNRKS